jgi:hypothetical protein
MKRISSIMLALIILMTACNNKKPKETVTMTSEDGKEKVTVNVNQMQDAANEMQKATEDLQKLPPLSLDQLKALIPEELMGGKKTRYNATSAMGAGMATAEYKINDSTDIKLTLYDCGGPGGAGIYSMQYLGMMNMESESEDEYTKSIDFNGGRAFEQCKKTRVECTLTYFAGGRFLVSLNGDNVNADGLKQAAKSLNVK